MPGPIEHVVILVKENHGYDNYFRRFPGADGDGTLANAANPPAVDPSHTHKAWLNRATGAVREQYGSSDIPTYWAYAQQYTLCDRYFTEIAGPSTPNHLMLIAADSPWIDNPPGNYRVQSTQVVDIPSLPAQLEQAGHTWGNYGGYAFEFVKAHAGKQFPSTQFAADAAAGKLPTVSWVYARQPRPVPRPRRVREGRPHLAPAAFAHQPRPLLRDDVRPAVAERAHRGCRRHGQLLRLHARAAAAERKAHAHAYGDPHPHADAAGPDGSSPHRSQTPPHGRTPASQRQRRRAPMPRSSSSSTTRPGRRPHYETHRGRQLTPRTQPHLRSGVSSWDRCRLSRMDASAASWCNPRVGGDSDGGRSGPGARC